MKMKIRTMKNKIFTALLISVLCIADWRCTSLDEEILDESLTGQGQAEAVSGAIAPAYGQLALSWRHTNNFGLQEIASDEAILPYRGGTDWYDGGKFMDMHKHLPTSGNGLVTDTWVQLSKNLATEH